MHRCVSHAAFFNTRSGSGQTLWQLLFPVSATCLWHVVSSGETGTPGARVSAWATHTDVAMASSEQRTQTWPRPAVGNAHRRGHGQPWATRSAISAVTRQGVHLHYHACGQTNHTLCLPWPRKGKFP
jgi:hypothetical protein